MLAVCFSLFSLIHNVHLISLSLSIKQNLKSPITVFFLYCRAFLKGLKHIAHSCCLSSWLLALFYFNGFCLFVILNSLCLWIIFIPIAITRFGFCNTVVTLFGLCDTAHWDLTNRTVQMFQCPWPPDLFHS